MPSHDSIPGNHRRRKPLARERWIPRLSLAPSTENRWEAPCLHRSGCNPRGKVAVSGGRPCRRRYIIRSKLTNIVRLRGAGRIRQTCFLEALSLIAIAPSPPLAFLCCMQVVTALLRRGADPARKDGLGRTAAMCAVIAGRAGALREVRV